MLNLICGCFIIGLCLSICLAVNYDRLVAWVPQCNEVWLCEAGTSLVMLCTPVLWWNGIHKNRHTCMHAHTPLYIYLCEYFLWRNTLPNPYSHTSTSIWESVNTSSNLRKSITILVLIWGIYLTSVFQIKFFLLLQAQTHVVTFTTVWLILAEII